MANKLVNNKLLPARYNNYLIAGNLTNAFAIGEIGSSEDFFIVGSEPAEESMYPMITGNFLDSEGNLLFKLIRNTLVMNPGKCSKIIGDHLGYEIHDSDGNLIFKIDTKFVETPIIQEECFLTTITAKFFDRKGNIVFTANSGDQDERIETNTKSLFGYNAENESIGIKIGYDDKELEFLKILFKSNGKINQPITGNFEGQTIELDGKILRNTTLKKCQINIRTGDFKLANNVKIDECKITFHDQAEELFKLFKKLIDPAKNNTDHIIDNET